jgi:type II restriction enzyme
LNVTFRWSGGKGIEVAGSYADLQRRFKENGLEFIWVTDGPGWAGMKSTLQTAFKDIDFLLNYKLFEKNFTKIITAIK